MCHNPDYRRPFYFEIQIGRLVTSTATTLIQTDFASRPRSFKGGAKMTSRMCDILNVVLSIEHRIQVREWSIISFGGHSDFMNCLFGTGLKHSRMMLGPRSLYCAASRYCAQDAILWCVLLSFWYRSLPITSRIASTCQFIGQRPNILKAQHSEYRRSPGRTWALEPVSTGVLD